MDRRRLLIALAAGLVSAAAGHGVRETDRPRPAFRTAGSAAAGRAAVVPRPGVAHPVARPPGVVPVPAPAGVISGLPGNGRDLALTIDDGVDSHVVAAFATLAVDTGIRLTFFPNGCYRSWQESAAVLRPLVESGQVALGNHTWSHPDVTTLPDRQVAEQIRRNRDFLQRTFGAGDTPFFRPPYGRHDGRTDRIAADLGHRTIALWNGTLGDDRLLTAADLLTNARRWFAAQTIVVGHANHPTVTGVYGGLLALIRERGLRTVTLADVWAQPAPSRRGEGEAGRVRAR